MTYIERAAKLLFSIWFLSYIYLSIFARMRKGEERKEDRHDSFYYGGKGSGVLIFWFFLCWCFLELIWLSLTEPFSFLSFPASFAFVFFLLFSPFFTPYTPATNFGSLDLGFGVFIVFGSACVCVCVFCVGGLRVELAGWCVWHVLVLSSCLVCCMAKSLPHILISRPFFVSFGWFSIFFPSSLSLCLGLGRVGGLVGFWVIDRLGYNGFVFPSTYLSIYLYFGR